VGPGVVAMGNSQARAFQARSESSPLAPIAVVTAARLGLAWSDVWWAAGCGRVELRPVLGRFEG